MNSHLRRSITRLSHQFPITRRLINRNSIKFTLLQIIQQRKRTSSFQFKTNRFRSSIHRLKSHRFIQITSVSQPHRIIKHYNRRTRRSLSRIISVLRATNLLTITMSNSLLTTRHLRSRVQGRTTIISIRFQTMNIRCTSSFRQGTIFTMMTRRRQLNTTFTFIMTQTRSRQICISPMVLQLKVSRQITMCFKNQDLRSFYIITINSNRRIRNTCSQNLHHLSQIILMMSQQYQTNRIMGLLSFNRVKMSSIITSSFRIKIF